MSKKSITKNYLYNVSYQILVLILPVITVPYLSRVLGPENIGIYGYTTAILMYFTILGALGLNTYAQREIAYVQGDKKSASKIFYEVIMLRIITVAISSLIFYFTFATRGEYQIYYKILLIELIATVFDITWFFQGLEEFKKTVTRNFFIKIISIICLFIFVKTQEDLKIYIFINAVSVFLGNLSLWLYLPKYICKIDFKNIKILKHLKPSIYLFIPQIAIQVYVVLDKVMLGTLLSEISEVAYYEQAQKIIKMVLTLITSLGVVMLPRMANTIANKEFEQAKKYMNKSFNFVYLLGIPMILGIILISDNFVPIFFGQGYENVAIVMKIISPIILFIGMSNITGAQYLVAAKRQKEFTISVVLGAIINVILNFILIPKYGAIGASVGTVIAELNVVVIQIIYIRKDIDMKMIIKLSKNYLIAGIIMFIISYFSQYLFNNLYYKLGIQIIVGIVSYFAVLIILKDEMLKNILEKVTSKLKGKKV